MEILETGGNYHVIRTERKRPRACRVCAHSCISRSCSDCYSLPAWPRDRQHFQQHRSEHLNEPNGSRRVTAYLVTYAKPDRKVGFCFKCRVDPIGLPDRIAMTFSRNNLNYPLNYVRETNRKN